MPALTTPPLPFDAARVVRAFDTLKEAGFAPPDDKAGALLAGAFGNSGFLVRLALREVQTLQDYFSRGPEPILQDACALALGPFDSEAEAMAALRRAKRRAALAIALADLDGWSLAQVTGALTMFADACLKGALRFLLRQMAASQDFAEPDGATLEATTGLTILAMGKYGAHELNYSSDIDLVVFYDAEKFFFHKRGDPRGAAVDLVRGLVKLIAETNQEGYVFRVDLRLRPDAGSTQVAISTAAALDYYESQGQNWERAAMIKARAVAGDPQTGAEFLKAIAPFIWRRHLDFAAIEDIHSIKRQIHAHEGHGEIAVAGHNIKLGRGGIREIEFFAQTQQLILGGRNPALRASATLAALKALAANGTITLEAAEDMTHCYVYLRTLEHRLQMVEDQQTHKLPDSQEGLAHIACFMGYDGIPAFHAAFTKIAQTVEAHYARLFEREPDLTDIHGNLVFTGVEEDPETLKTLAAMGFKDAAHVSAAIRGWHHGRVRAMRSARARELLTKLMPLLLVALAATPDPDSAFIQFDRFLSGLPSGVQLFSLFLARPDFLGLLARSLGSAPRLSLYLARNPSTLDALLDADFLNLLPTRAQLDAALASWLTGTYEEMLDGARRFTREEIFRVGVQIVDGAARADHAGAALTNIAEAVIAGLLPRVEAELAGTAGHVPGSGFAVIALGKLGGREMTASSDLDLVFVYEMPPGVENSDGPKPLAAPLYFARLAQRLIAALTTPTAAGALYDVDMRLRPTGNKGPAAVSLKSFADYHASESWTWEHMALTRARLVAGPESLRRRIEEEIARRLTAKPDSAKILTDVRQMRAKVEATYPGRNGWDLKYAPGGLMDIEFIAQTLQLLHAHDRPGILDTNTIGALEKIAAAGFLSPDDAGLLLQSAALEQALTQTLRIALDEELKSDAATPALQALLARAGHAPDFATLEQRLTGLRQRVRAAFVRLTLSDG
jgi:glutamate-ammonia-ligase adenylyltransferase